MAGRPLAPEELESVPTVELLNELKRRHHLLGRPPARVAVLGPPCVGKRTQAEAFRRAFGLCRISAADLFQPPAAAAASAVGAGAAEGDAPRSPAQPVGSADERAVATLSALLDRAQCRRGFVLEGFPKTVPQAQRLQEELERRGTPLDNAIFLDAPDDVLLERCRGRLLHPRSGRLYHDQFKPPLDEGLDDYTGEQLARPAHDEEIFQRDRSKYNEDSVLLHEYFKRAGLAREVAATGNAEQVANSCAEAIKPQAAAA